MMIEIASPPRTLMEVYKMLPEGTLTDLIDERLYIWPVPYTAHQRVKGNLIVQLADFVEENFLGEVLLGPLDIYLDTFQNVVQPDILFVSNENSVQPHNYNPYEGVPELIIEILSDHNRDHDLITKKNLYEKFRVQEYWIIDPSSKEAIVYQLAGNEYVPTSKTTNTVFSPLLNYSFSF